MSQQIVCPLSAASDSYKQCHPRCKLLKDGECLLTLFLETASTAKSISES
ncbi:hypothetical protein [Alkaliphilus sp. B6464]|nr:hypothetical protein [Alkaliphilus sp. B6464]QUH21111.1 hypothetical protein HYG84_15290 [Alkaliphilus sp. B6464]